MNFGDLRAILQYVPQFRGSTFVIALDGAVVDSPDFSNILLDLAVLRSLNINVVLVHGAAAQIEKLAENRKIELSNSTGSGVTDRETLEISIDAISRLTNSIMQSLASLNIRAATANAIRAHRAGIVGGTDFEFTGRIDEVDSKMLKSFLEEEIMPIVPPIAFDGEGETLRINSDALAREVAISLGAEKIVFLSISDPLSLVDSETRQWSSEVAADYLQTTRDEISSGFYSKVKEGIRATREKVPRVHMIGAEKNDALLAELFSNEGVGLMIYADDYHEVRRAVLADADEIYSLIRRAVEDEQLLERKRGDIVSRISDYQVLSIDENIVGCVAVHHFEDEKIAEMACLYVKKGHNGLGYGQILIDAARRRASDLKVQSLVALSTQAADYLQKAGFKKDSDLSALPQERRNEWEANGRNAVLLVAEIS